MMGMAMSSKVIGLMQLEDLAAFEDYRSRVGQTVELYRGKIISRGVVTDLFWNELGCDAFGVFVELEFPSQIDAQTWVNSQEYQSLVAVRSKAMKLTLFAATL